MENENTSKLEPALAPNVNNLLPSVHAEDSEREEGFTIVTDGFCKPNPQGIGAWAIAIYCPHGGLLDSDFDDIGSGEGVTLNVSKYVAVLEALVWAVECVPDAPVAILTNSELVANHINGNAACNKPHLKELLEDALELQSHSKASVLWVPKAETEVASALAKLAYVMAKREAERGGND